MLCNLYMVVLLVYLPLYIGRDGYWKLGDGKYLLFRNVSMLCLGIWGVMTLGSAVVMLFGKIRRYRWTQTKWSQIKCSSVDGMMAGYALFVLISFACSPYRDTAWRGYRDWYMGALSQLLFVGIYFFVSRNYDRQKYVLYLGEAAALAVTVIGLLNRLGVDPIGVYQNYGETDWEYSHMLSTIGNINWLCGYLSLALVIPVTHYLEYDENDKHVKKYSLYVLYGINVLGLVLLCIQGSDSGPVLAGIILLLCVFVRGGKNLTEAGKRDVFRNMQKGLSLAAGVAFGIPLMNVLISLAGSIDRTPYDGRSHAFLAWNGWWFAAAVLWISYFVLRKISRNIEQDAGGEEHRVSYSAFFVIVLCILVLTMGGLAGKSVSDDWGSGRGALWRTAWKGFAEAPLGQKLIGAGPDCFAEVLDTVMDESGRWAGAVYANAHNEWLNQLVNIGILGTVCYMGIFLSGWKRYRGCRLGVFAICIYWVHSLVSFQQVLNAPLLFLVLGICESRCRQEIPDFH